ncbi:aromatic acid exporter family protein [Paenibacillus silviterrae]|jgi:uncharacterized membrane protein YgaE (UPF0421/DUF939 family)|uniref:aromatic acid exporter family protein n=1 Tax=Paenibacillus silviterrae TaxID=3242194 RepID=UPI00254278D0|nr:aromatic acid exporter family protein [Paenibacillus chinjuensis]
MGFRVIKTALAVVISILISQALGLHSPLSSGLLAILGVDVTKRRGLRTSLQRLAASILGLLIAALLFYVFGFQVWVIGLFLLILFPILSRLELREGAVTGSVVMFHLFAAESVDPHLILNEVCLLLVGLGTATLINISYMPKEDKRLAGLKERLEYCFSRIFTEIAGHLRNTAHIWDGNELLLAHDLLEDGWKAAQRSNENTLWFGETDSWSTYISMRKQQMESVDRMIPLVAQVYQTLSHGELLANVFEELSKDVFVDYYTGRAEQLLLQLESRFKQTALPATREEFEVRSALLQLLMELKHYLSIAKREKKKFSKETI